jgi:hypothetical protein
MLYSQKMISYFHNTTATVTAGNKRQGKHINSEYMDGYFHKPQK